MFTARNIVLAIKRNGNDPGPLNSTGISGIAVILLFKAINDPTGSD
ncbi:MAG: hypothetical protein CM15mP104_3050 [Gammaproteobacteria bacterium]|nr:MAG: hypothetical protein CM15mP104_3050 [Gammaproteobacteria bacterium]